MRLVTWWMAALARFARDRDGNFTIIFGLAIVPVMGVMGLAVDYTLALRMRTALNAAADAATLAALTTASNVMNGASNNSFAAAQTAGIQAAKTVFAANAYPFPIPATMSYAIEQKPSDPFVLTGTVSYTNATSQNYFGQIFGTNTINFDGKAISSTTLNRYINIYIVVDISQSMGIAGSAADMAKLFAATKAVQGEGCVFACHVVKNGYTTTNEAIARTNNVRLRIDIIKDAVKGIINRAAKANTVYPLEKIGLYTFEKTLKSLSPTGPTAPTSTSLNAMLATADNIDLGSETDGGGTGDSWSQTALASLTSGGSPIVGPSGDGTTPSTPLNYVFILTDGTSDMPGGCTTGHCVTTYSPGSTDWCGPLKTNATVGVIYTTYLPIYDQNTPPTYENAYSILILPINQPVNGVTPINQKLQSCSTQTGSWFFEASDETDINNALNALFSQATAGTRLTN